MIELLLLIGAFVLLVLFFKVVAAILIWPLKALFWVLGGLFTLILLPFQIVGGLLLAVLLMPVLLAGFVLVVGVGAPLLAVLGVGVVILAVVGTLALLGGLLLGGC